MCKMLLVRHLLVSFCIFLSSEWCNVGATKRGSWKRFGFPHQLLFKCNIIFVNMRVSGHMYENELGNLQRCNPRNHLGQQRVRSNVKRDPKSKIGTALLQQAFQLGAILDKELRQIVTWRQHLISFFTHEDMIMRRLVGSLRKQLTTSSNWSTPP